jgi:putative hydrolase of the HAD superfamily
MIINLIDGGFMADRLVIFDLDDTLIKTQYKYDLAGARYSTYIKNLFGDIKTDDDIKKDMRETQYRMIRKIGLIRTCYPMSAVELYFHYCAVYQRQVQFSEVEQIITIVNTVFDGADELSDECVGMFLKLKEQGYQLYVLTSGDNLIQTYKVFKCGLYNFIDINHTIIVPQKDNTVYQNYFKDFGYDNCVMIGNSLKNDIKPAVSVGMHAIHIPSTTWEFDNAEMDADESYYVVNSINDVPAVINKIFA